MCTDEGTTRTINQHIRVAALSLQYCISLRRLLVKGYRHTITLEDIWELRPWERSCVLVEKMERAWDIEVRKAIRRQYQCAINAALISDSQSQSIT